MTMEEARGFEDVAGNVLLIKGARCRTDGVKYAFRNEQVTHIRRARLRNGECLGNTVRVLVAIALDIAMVRIVFVVI